MWYTDKEETPYGHAENISLLSMAYKAIYANEALLGVVGVEFVYDNLVEYMKKFGCTTNTDESRCYLIDEHAYIVYSSQKDVIYSDTLHRNKTSKPKVLGSFFGHLNRITEWTMELLLKQGFFTETTYWDNQVTSLKCLVIVYFQAMCDQQTQVIAFSYGMKVWF